MASVRRQHYAYAPAPHKALPITMPSKAPAGYYPVSRVAMSPAEVSDASTVGGSRTSASYSANSSSYAGSASEYDTSSSGSYPSVDVVDMLSDRMNSAFDPIRMDKALATQAQT